MQLKEKTWYERRDGKSALCHVRAKGDKHDFPWAVECNGSMETYNDDGSYSNQPNSQMDLIREIGHTLEEKPKLSDAEKSFHAKCANIVEKPEKEMDREKVWEIYRDMLETQYMQYVRDDNGSYNLNEIMDDAINAYKVFAERFK